jgi:hypothetical protein
LVQRWLRNARPSRDINAYEGTTDRWTAHSIASILDVGADGTYRVSYFFDDASWLSGKDLVASLAATSAGPNLWFPAHMAWIAATPIDDFQTYIGANKSVIDALSDDLSLEVVKFQTST